MYSDFTDVFLEFIIISFFMENNLILKMNIKIACPDLPAFFLRQVKK